MTLFQILLHFAIPLLVLTTFCVWRAVSIVAIELDSEDWWDLADFIAGAYAGVASLALALIALQRDLAVGAASANTTGVALKYGVSFGYAMLLACWFLSLWLENETDYARPESLRPAGERFWDTQLAWLPWSPEGGWGWT